MFYKQRVPVCSVLSPHFELISHFVENSMLPTALFSQIKPTGDALDLKERHTMTALGKLCYIYGGYMRISEKHYANMHVLDTGTHFILVFILAYFRDALTLTLLNTHGEVPSARCMELNCSVWEFAFLTCRWALCCCDRQCNLLFRRPYQIEKYAIYCCF